MNEKIKTAAEVAMENARSFVEGAVGVPEEKKRKPIPLSDEDIQLLKLALQTVAGQTANEYTRRRCVLIGQKLDGKENP